MHARTKSAFELDMGQEAMDDDAVTACKETAAFLPGPVDSRNHEDQASAAGAQRLDMGCQRFP